MALNQGKYTLENRRKYIGDPKNVVYRSGWELKFFLWCDRSPRVLSWGSEEIVIPYYHRTSQKMRRYYVDGVVKYLKRDDTIVNYLVEIKPYKQTIPPKKPKKPGLKGDARYMREMVTYMQNQDKWNEARKFAEKKDMEFVILTENELNISR